MIIDILIFVLAAMITGILSRKVAIMTLYKDDEKPEIDVYAAWWGIVWTMFLLAVIGVWEMVKLYPIQIL